MRVFVAVVATTLTVAPGRAGVYHPAEPTPFVVSDAGVATDLPFGTQFDGPFPLQFTRWANVADATPTRASNPDRKAVQDRLGDYRQRLARLKPDPLTSATMAADLIRLGRADEAVNLLRPFSRDRSPVFEAVANLAHAHATRQEWAEALNLHDVMDDDTLVPPTLQGATPAQRTFLRRVERDHYRRWLAEHRKRAAAKADPAAEEVFPLFPGAKPADAVAVVQQLLLWAPWDTALYWLLAELYADAGRVREAALILDKIVESRQYSNRRKLMARRAELRDAAAALPPEAGDVPLVAAAPAADPAAFLPSRRAAQVGAGAFAAFAGLMLALQVRRWRRRLGERPV